MPLARKIKRCILIIWCICATLIINAQKATAPLRDIIAAVDSARIKRPYEKVYLQFDKNDYVIGDTVWFKAYVFNAAYLTASGQSSILYIEVANEYNEVIRRFRLPILEGFTWGNISLDKENYTIGAYTIRAYTMWQRNFGDEGFFSHPFNVVSADANTLLVSTHTRLFNLNERDSVRAILSFFSIDKQPFSNKQLELNVSTGRRPLYKSNITTTQQGVAAINFTLPGNPLHTTIMATDKASSKKIVIPLLLGRSKNIDLQFMPEGGYLVAGLQARVAFKAIDEDGRGGDIQGIITDDSNHVVAKFASLHKGMGSFNLQPEAGKNYTATLNLPGGDQKKFALPAVQPGGVAMHVNNPLHGDSIDILVSSTPGSPKTGDSFLLVGQARNVICYTQYVDFHSTVTSRYTIPKKLFPPSIARFTLFTKEGRPLDERLAFIPLNDSAKLNITANDTAYIPRDSIALTLSFTGPGKKPLQGSFSLSVTDDARVRQNFNTQQNIISYILLSSDLKGYIEDPAYYLEQQDSLVWQALDNLLLTQGWKGYSWEDIFTQPPLQYEPEKAIAIKGTVTNIFKKGLSHTEISLLSKNPPLLLDTSTDDKGRFVFEGFPALDTPIFTIQARNKHGKSFNVGISVDDVAPPAFIMPPAPLTLPWYVNTDTTLIAFAQAKQVLDKKLTEGMTLAPVTVYGKKKVQDSQNLNGSGNADLVLDETDMEKAGKQTLDEILETKVPNLRVKIFPYANFKWYYIGYKWVRLVFDGIQLQDIYHFSSLEDLKTYLQLYKAEDIKGIEVNESFKYNTEYIRRFIPANEQITIDWTTFGFAFIEITTRSGKGPVPQFTPGVYLYRGVPFSWPAKFYSPRYAVKDTGDHFPDVRTTIYWEPNIITDSTGEAKIFFFAADNPTTYTAVIEGTDFNGDVIVKRKKITVVQKKKE
ncbi:MAG TPA: hypothetical protein VG738_03005 [Chitinophagaceae bacterium]|nr:hypothetical protein [Chitinophagaceae bacterium]